MSLRKLRKVTSGKDLGLFVMFVDNKLLFREHIAKKVGTANRNLGLIFKNLHLYMFLILYNL